MEGLDVKSNVVDITITAPSDGERENSASSSENEETSDVNENSFDTPTENSMRLNDDGNDDSEELCERFDSGVSLNDEKFSPENRKKIQREGKSFDTVSDRVLIEKDGKFELVDANEIKAEYFEMLGIKPAGQRGNNESNRNLDHRDSSNDVRSVKNRPKTTPSHGKRNKEIESKNASGRIQSSGGYRNPEYSNIKSPYALSEKQLEIKKKREEAIARRKKEEADRQQEEERKKRENAEKAFQAWLNSKREEERERRQLMSRDMQDKDDSRIKESKKAYDAWKMAKRRQENKEREAELRKMQETASMYVVHDRGACEEAFKRWLKKKNDERKTKVMEKKKRLKMRKKQKPKEPLPINSEKIRFTDNYGYRNTVVY